MYDLRSELIVSPTLNRRVFKPCLNSPLQAKMGRGDCGAREKHVLNRLLIVSRLFLASSASFFQGREPQR